MISPAWKHRDNVLRAQAAAAAKAAVEKKDETTIKTLAGDKARFELLLTALDNDCTRISALPKGSARTELKRELLKTWLPVVDAYIAGGSIFANPVLTQVMIWCWDTGDINNALRLTNVAIEQNQGMPERFSRNVKTYVADAFLDWCKEQQVNKSAIEPYFSEMLAKVMDWAIHDDIKLKYVKLAALEAKAAGDPERALELCEQAEKIDSKKAQVKTLKAELEKAVAAQKEAARHKAAKAGKTEE